jgi:hypothetical protein
VSVPVVDVARGRIVVHPPAVVDAGSGDGSPPPPDPLPQGEGGSGTRRLAQPRCPTQATHPDAAYPTHRAHPAGQTGPGSAASTPSSCGGQS